jgi:hypothetical protein
MKKIKLFVCFFLFASKKKRLTQYTSLYYKMSNSNSNYDIDLYVFDPSPNNLSNPFIIKVECHILLNDSNFIKSAKTIQNCKKIVIALYYEYEEELYKIVAWLVSKDITKFLNRKVISETHNYLANYTFNQKGDEIMNKLNIEKIKKLMLIFDSIDIKPQLSAIISYALNKNRMDTIELNTFIKQQRLKSADLYYK